VHNTGKFPRLLIVAKRLVDHTSGNGASLRNWFIQWPKDRLAQICSSPLADEAFVPNVYRLAGQDRRGGAVFDTMKRYCSVLGSSEPVHELGSAPDRTLTPRIHALAHRVVVSSGLWELFFRPKVSRELSAWVEQFGPQVIFAQGADLSFLTLPFMLSQQFGIPVCLMVNDDWPAHLYAKSWTAPVMRPAVDRAFKKLLHRCSARFGTGDYMCAEYEARYHERFHPLMICDDSIRFSNAAAIRRVLPSDISIVYCGSLGANRWKAILDLAGAAEIVAASGRRITISVFAPDLPVRGAAVAAHPLIELRPPCPHADLPGLLKGADILFLAESFDETSRDYIRYSISTKCHLYMMSGRPIIAYGPPEVGTIQYAAMQEWAMVVDRPDPQMLAHAINCILEKSELSTRTIARARTVATQNHEGNRVREDLRSILQQSCDRFSIVGPDTRKECTERPTPPRTRV